MKYLIINKIKKNKLKIKEKKYNWQLNFRKDEEI